MHKKTIVTVIFWYGALLDGLMGILMIISMFSQTIIIPYFSSEMNFQFAMGGGASLMLGWTVLLFWAGFKPIERREIMIITSIPVVLGFIIGELLIDPMELFVIWMYQIIGCIVPCIFGYILALKVKKNEVNHQI